MSSIVGLVALGGRAGRSRGELGGLWLSTRHRWQCGHRGGGGHLGGSPEVTHYLLESQLGRVLISFFEHL